MLFSLVVSCFLVFFRTPVFCQNYSLEPFFTEIEIRDSLNEPLLNPWVGGLNSPIFSYMDFNGDGLMDIFAFDRMDESSHIFIRQPDKITFKWTPSYLRYLPLEYLNYWVLLRDMNNDGLMDIVTSDDQFNLAILWNQSKTKTEIKFSPPFTPKAYFRESPSDTNQSLIYVPPTDICGYADIDFDGDIDFLINNTDGSSVIYYKNFAKEWYNRNDTLVMEIKSLCWGHFQEIFNAVDNDYDVDLNQSPCRFDSKTSHVGGTITPLSLNGDTLMDVLISDVGVNNVIAITNGGNRRIANMTGKERFYPSKDSSINIFYFPAMYLVPINADTTLDLLVSPNTKGEGEDVNCVWHYHNTGTNLMPEFKLKEKNFLVNQTLDWGSHATPVLFDFNQDDLQDLVIANGTQFINPITSRANLSVLLNTGTAKEPKYQLKTNNLLEYTGSANNFHPLFLAPAFGDLDGDGDPDLLLGQLSSGYISYWENIGFKTDGMPKFELKTQNFLNFELGAQINSAPVLKDMDNDKDLDLIIGIGSGRILYYQNTGTPTQAKFEFITDNYGKIRVVDSDEPYAGRAYPVFFDINRDEKEELIIGSGGGKFWVYEVCPQQQDSFQLLQIINPPFWKVAPLRLALTNLLGQTTEQDSLLWIIGSPRGGVILQKSSFSEVFAKDNFCKTNIPPIITYNYALYPNPVADSDNYVTITFPDSAKLEIYDILGRKVIESPVGQKSPYQLSVMNLASGVYQLRIHTSAETKILRFIR